VLDFTAKVSGGADAKRFKIEPQRLLYSLQWRHNGTPPGLHLQLVNNPAICFEPVANMLLGSFPND
jgi:hypothetical protein